MLTVPWVLSSPYSFWSYQQAFPESWYDVPEQGPKPLGLILGITAVAVGQVWVYLFFYLHKFGYLGSTGESEPVDPLSVQTKGPPVYEFWEGLQTHVSQPEGFVVLVSYLSITWMCRLMPPAYYSFEGSIQLPELMCCLVVQDGLQYVMHRLEHDLSPAFYRWSHKPHHRFTNPRLFDAFNGSLLDTICMIIIPLLATAHLVRSCNVWTYMAFGSTYANWLTLIHSEYAFPWDHCIFRRLGFGTPADHHVHHKFFKFNFGHLFMWFDQLCGTYRDPKAFAPKVFNPKV
jgi:alternative squalene epoxidase